MILRSVLFDHGLFPPSIGVEDESSVGLLSEEDILSLASLGEKLFTEEGGSIHKYSVTGSRCVRALYRAVKTKNENEFGSFLLFLVIQTYFYKRNWDADTHWPNMEDEVGDAGSPGDPKSRSLSTELANRIAFVKFYLKEMLWVIYRSGSNERLSFSTFSSKYGTLPAVRKDISCLSILFDDANFDDIKNYAMLEHAVLESLEDSLALAHAPTPSTLLEMDSRYGAVYRNENEKTLVISNAQKSYMLENDNMLESVLIHNCQNATFYLLAPIKHCKLVQCRNLVVVLGPCAGVMTMEHCRNVELTVATSYLFIGNSFDSKLHVHCDKLEPILFGDIGNIELGPYNTVYPKLSQHLDLAQIDKSNEEQLWCQAKLVSESSICQFSIQPPSAFWISSCPVTEEMNSGLPFPVPSDYLESLEERLEQVEILNRRMNAITCDTSDLEKLVYGSFRDWLHTRGHTRHIADIISMKKI